MPEGFRGGKIAETPSLDECVDCRWPHRRYWHLGENGEGECTRLDCGCKAGRYLTEKK